MKNRFILVKVSKAQAGAQSELWSPKFESDVDASKALKVGQEASCSFSDSDLRNLGHHRKLFALLKLAFQNLPPKLEEMFKNVDELRKELLMQTGYREERVSMGGQKYYVPKSMAFGVMGKAEFEELYGKFVDVICKYILSGVDSEELNSQIVNFL